MSVYPCQVSSSVVSGKAEQRTNISARLQEKKVELESLTGEINVLQERLYSLREKISHLETDIERPQIRKNFVRQTVPCSGMSPNSKSADEKQLGGMPFQMGSLSNILCLLAQQQEKEELNSSRSEYRDLLQQKEAVEADIFSLLVEERNLRSPSPSSETEEG